MSIQCILWDFGDTLCDEKFIWSSGPGWETVYELLDQGWGEAWNSGEMSDLEFASLAAEHIPMDPQDILAHMHERWVSHNSHLLKMASEYQKKAVVIALLLDNDCRWGKRCGSFKDHV